MEDVCKSVVNENGLDVNKDVDESVVDVFKDVLNKSLVVFCSYSGVSVNQSALLLVSDWLSRGASSLVAGVRPWSVFLCDDWVTCCFKHYCSAAPRTLLLQRRLHGFINLNLWRRETREARHCSSLSLKHLKIYGAVLPAAATSSNTIIKQ